MIANTAALTDAANDGKVFREFTDGQAVFGGFVVMGSGSVGSPFYLQSTSSGQHVKISGMKYAEPTSYNPVKTKGFMLQLNNSNQIAAMGSPINVTGISALEEITYSTLDDAFDNLGITDWAGYNNNNIILKDSISLAVGYDSTMGNVNLQEPQWAKTLKYIEKNVAHLIGSGNLVLSTGRGYFRYENASVPYSGNDVATTGIFATPMNGDLAYWMLKNGIALSQVRVGDRTAGAGTTTAAVKNVVFGDNWENVNFSASPWIGVITFNNLPANIPASISNLWLVVNGDVGTTHTVNMYKVLDFGPSASGINKFSQTGGLSNIRVVSKAQFNSLDPSIRGSLRKAVWIDNKYVKSNTGSTYNSSSSANEIYVYKEGFAFDVMKGYPLGTTNTTPQYMYTSEASLLSTLVWANEGAITMLSPKKGIRADWWQDPVNPMEVFEMARRMKGDILAPTAGERRGDTFPIGKLGAQG
jgi:hypothetical protein